MSISRRASFAAGIAAARRERRGVGGGGGHRRLLEGGSSFEDQGDDSGTVVTTTTTSTRTTTLRMASSIKDSTNAINVDTASVNSKNGKPPFDMSNMAKMAGIAGAALAAEKIKPKMSVEVRSFTKESLEKINLRTTNLIRDYGFLPKRSPHLLDGAQLPPKYEPFPMELLGKPVEELDQYVYEKTFCVVSRRFNKNYVQRFSATRAMFIFQPWNIVRCIAIYLSTNQLFDYCVMFTILINCIFLAQSETNEEAEYIFLAIYSLESLIKCIAKGFILNNYTYLRSPWNWLDFLVILSGYLTSFIEMGNLAGLRTFRVLRALKTISILPSLRTIINALLNAVKQLAEVMTLTIFCLMVFALFALQVYMGQLRNKCVLDIEQYDEGNGPKNWTEWVLNEENWFIDDKGNPELCGNATGAKPCPEGYVCLPNVGGNPNYGYTSFDNLLWSMLTTFQLITLDYWENVYNKIVATGGPMHVIFFTIVVFFGSFYLINLMLAVVAMSYEEEAEANNAERLKEAEEAAAMNQVKQQQPEEEECTIRTNAPQLIYGSVSPEDMCGQCSKNSKEALERGRVSVHSGRSFEASKNGGHGHGSEECTGNRVVIKARQVGSEIHSLDLHSNYDPHNLGNSFYKGGDTYEARFHSSLDASSIGGGSLDEGKHGHNRNQLLSPTMEEGQGFYHSDDQYSLSNYSSGGFSNKSSLNDSGVVGDQEMDSVSEDKLRLQAPKSEHDGEIINCKDKANGGKRVSGPDNPMVVSIETTEDRNCAGCRRCCVSYSCWLKFQDFLFKVVHTTLVETAVTLCIILNTAFLAIEHHGMSQELDETLETGNKVFTAFFTLEASLKLLAMSKQYFESGWNIFDLIIVVASLIDLSVESVNGISVLRGMRLMRVLKLAQSWTTMKVLLSIIISTLGALGNLTFLLIIVIYIFAVLGMQLFGKTYTEENFYPDPVPRWNFTDFFHSFMMIFRILCGEWIEPLWDCMRAEARIGVAESCLAIFLPALVVGNFMVLNLFLALLLNSFNCEELKSRKESLEKHEEVKSEGGSAVASKLSKVKDKLTWKKKKDKNNLEDSKSQKFSSNGSLLSQNGLKPTLAVEDEKTMTKMHGGEHGIFAITRSGDQVFAPFDHTRPLCQSPPVTHTNEKGKSLTFDEALAGENGDVDPEAEVKSKVPEQCCPILCGKIFWCCDCLAGTFIDRTWKTFRQVIHDVVDNPFFEWTILLLIFASSLSLCFEDINLQDNEELMFILKIVNMVFAVLFTIEMVLKWVAFGLWRYFTSAWTCLDFVIVCVSILSLAVEGSANLTALRSLRTLRALRPLRAISRWQGMKIVVNALMYAIPSIFNVLLVCLVFWLIFSIMGVQFFGGKFYKCVDESGDRLPIEVVDNKYECSEKNYTWVNSKITFDHVGHAYLALFQVATFEGWMEVMADAVDCREVDQQPSYEASKYNYFYFVIFIVCGSFFTLNLFIGVIIDNFNALKKKYEGGVLEMFLTESQKNYYTAMKKLGRKKPQKVVRRPTNEMHALFYDISLSRRFEIAIFVLIFLNMVAMGIEHYNQSRVITFTLEISNALFTTIFSLECLVKIVGLRFQYFTVGWNIFDFVLVIASIIGIVMEDMMEDFPVSPTLLRVVRVFRIGRILRLIKAAKGIRKLLFALIVSLPALFNIGALLALITFIYAIIGMTLFGHVKHQGALNDQVNFETFGRSMQLLFRLVTSAGWNDVLEPLLVTPPDCDSDFKDLPNGNCGHPFVAIIYFVSFIIINFMIVINMYIAIILENFNQAHQEEEIGIVEEDLEMFYTKWAKFDPHATQFISFHQMSDFIASLDAPLGIPKPNLLALVSFDLPIAKGDKIHCLDVLHSLTKYTLGFIDDNSEDFTKLAGQMDEKFKKQFPTRKELEIVSSTREWKKLDNAARIIQKFFKVYVQGVNIEERIDIHTQTFGQQRKAPRVIKPVTTGGTNNYLTNEHEMGSDTEWKTQSLPSLGHVSSDNTLESSADDYGPTRKISQKRNRKKTKRNQPSGMSDEGEGTESKPPSDQEVESEEKQVSAHRNSITARGRGEPPKPRVDSEEDRISRHQYQQQTDYQREYPKHERDYPKHQEQGYPKDRATKDREYSKDREYIKDRDSKDRDYPKERDFSKDHHRDYPKERNNHGEKDFHSEQSRDYKREKDIDYPYTRDQEYPKHAAKDYTPVTDQDHDSDHQWNRRDPRRDRNPYQAVDFEQEEKPWDRKERYRDQQMAYASPVVSKAEMYRRLPQRPQSFSAAEPYIETQPRRKLPQVPIRGTGRPSSYVQSSRYRSLDEERQQPPQYHSNPHLSVGGPLPTHYESYYHELRLTEPRISPHSSLRQLPPTPSEMITGHRRTNSSGSFGRHHDEPESKYNAHRFSYQEGDLPLSRMARFGTGGQGNFSSLPRNHGGAVHYKDYYQSLLAQSPIPAIDDAFIAYPDEHTFPLHSYMGADDTLDNNLLSRPRVPMLDDPLIDDLHNIEDPAALFALSSYRDSQRYSAYVEAELEREKSLRSPDYYDYEAKYTSSGIDPKVYPLSDRLHMTTDPYLDTSPSVHRHSQEHHGVESTLSPNAGFKEWEHHHDSVASYRDRDLVDRERAYHRESLREVPDEPRVRIKPQLSWEQYSQEDPTDDLKYVVTEPEPSHHVAGRSESQQHQQQRHSQHEKSSFSSTTKSKAQNSPSKRRQEPEPHRQEASHRQGSSHRHEHRDSSQRQQDTSHESPSDEALRSKYRSETEKSRQDKKTTSKSRPTTDERKPRRHKKSSTTEAEPSKRSETREEEPTSSHPPASTRQATSGRGESQHRSDPSRRSIRRQPRIGSTARAERTGTREKREGNLSDAFDDDGLFQFEDTDASQTETKPSRSKKK